MHRRRGRSAGPEGERGVSTPPSLPLDTPLPWTGCGSQRMLRPLSGPCILLAAAPTTPPCFCRRQRSSSLQERGCSPLSDPKGVGSNRKYGRFTPFGVKIFSPYFRLPPIGKAPQSLRDSSPQGSGFREMVAARNGPSRENATLENLRIFQSCKSKNNSSAAIARVQRSRPPPAAETGRRGWGSGQQDARPAQGPPQTLGAATRQRRQF